MRDVITQPCKSGLNFACSFEGRLRVGEDVLLSDVFDEIAALQHLGGLVPGSAE